VFYHSYSLAALIYELQSCLAKYVYDIRTPPPFPRLLAAPFHEKPSLSMLIDEFRSLHQQDHDPRFRALAISASVSLFGEETEAPPTTSFEMGYSCTDLSFRGLLLAVLSACQLDHDLVDDVADEIVRIGGKYGLQTHPYVSKQTHSAPKVLCGQLLQIFIHRDFVDDICYASLPYGVPVTHSVPLSEKLLLGPATGQARVFMHPDIFSDQSRGIIYHYAADREYAEIGRDQMHEEMRTALSPIVGDPVALERASRSLRGLPFE
jgi:hypothetical protein